MCIVEVGTEDLGKNFAHLGDSRCEGGPVEAGHLQTYGDDNDQDDSDQRSAGAGPVDRMTVGQRNELRLEDAVKQRGFANVDFGHQCTSAVLGSVDLGTSLPL